MLLKFLKKVILNIKNRNLTNYKIDVFQKESLYSKRVLISYVLNSFEGKIDLAHSNRFEVLYIAKTFDAMNYIVDIVMHNSDVLSNNIFNNLTYEIVFGIEPNFLIAVKKFSPKYSIYYATGSHYEFQNTAELERIRAIKKRKGVDLKPRRQINPHNSYEKADFILGILNDKNSTTYHNYATKLLNLPISIYNPFAYPSIKNFKNAKSIKNYLWFGSNGAIHKGLDLLLEAFSDIIDCNLYVCGGIEEEKDFLKLYKKELFKTKNISYKGWVPINSKIFFDLVIQCQVVILPSCSESINGAVPTCMYSGLIPVITEETGVDVNGCGEIIREPTVQEIKRIISILKLKNETEIELMAYNSFRKSIEKYTIESYSVNLMNNLKTFLSTNGGR